jgi:hypothetical protein
LEAQDSLRPTKERIEELDELRKKEQKASERKSA